MKIKLLVAMLALLVTGCGQSSDNASPSPTSSASESSSPTPSDSAVLFGVKIYFVSDTGTSLRLFDERHAAPGINSDSTKDALTALLSGIKPIDPDYVNLWGPDSRLNSLTIVGDLATVDLHYTSLNVGAEGEMRAIEQILWTLKSNNEQIKQVEFLRDGAPMETFAGHVDATSIFIIDEGYQSLATVDLDIEDGQEIEEPFKVTGLACTFEANVPWELIQGKTIVDSGSVLAKEACPTRSSFAIELGDLAPGKYVLRVWESSMKDGSLINEDTKTFIVQ